LENINFDIRQLVEELVKAHSTRTIDKGLELNYLFSSSIPQFLIGDPNRLRQILNNLISNAIKFTENGEINIAVKKASNSKDEIELKFAVSDTGIGIAPEELSRLFKSFSQIENAFTKQYGGTGLGLVISKQLVEMMGGRIEVDSEKGKGSTFYFFLKFKVGSLLEERKQPLMRISKTTKPLHILLAEDDAINQKVIVKMLNEKGHSVDTANNGLEVVELYERGNYDVVLMDIQMPIMNGMEAVQKIRQKENKFKYTPIIAMTAYALQGDREKFLSQGMDEYVVKPIQMNELFFALEKVTSNIQYIAPDKLVLTENGEILFTSDRSSQSGRERVAKLAEIYKDIKTLESAAKRDNMNLIEQIANEIKTISNEIDVIDIKDTAFKIELAARRGNLTEAEKYIEQIHYEFKLYKNINE
jgi:CheY-like chemotaxis protein